MKSLDAPSDLCLVDSVIDGGLYAGPLEDSFLFNLSKDVGTEYQSAPARDEQYSLAKVDVVGKVTLSRPRLWEGMM